MIEPCLGVAQVLLNKPRIALDRFFRGSLSAAVDQMIALIVLTVAQDFYGF